MIPVHVNCCVVVDVKVSVNVHMGLCHICLCAI